MAFFFLERRGWDFLSESLPPYSDGEAVQYQMLIFVKFYQFTNPSN